jgi:archaellum component FlaC
MDRINRDLDVLEDELSDHELASTDETIRRMEALQEKFELVMGQLSAIDDDGGAAIEDAKEEFRKIVKRYRQSRAARRLP